MNSSKEKYYSADTVDAKLITISTKLDNQDFQRDAMHEIMKDVDKKIDGVIARQDYTNGKVRLHEKLFLIVGTAIIVLIASSGTGGVAKLIELITSLL